VSLAPEEELHGLGVEGVEGPFYLRHSDPKLELR
jgi:hypothetical protein